MKALSNASTASSTIIESKSHARLHELDGLRGILALFVVFYHLKEGLQAKYDVVNYPIIAGNGWYAVDVFFVLSGFVMTHVYSAAIERDGAWSIYRRFMAARIARLYPVHLFAGFLMLFCLLPTLWGTDRLLNPDGRYAWTAFLASLALLQGVWIDHRTWNYPAWSISAEFHAYLLAPFLIKYIRNSTVSVLFLLTSLLMPFFLYVFYYQDPNYPTNGLVILLRAIPLFVTGIALYRLRSHFIFHSNVMTVLTFVLTLSALSFQGAGPFALLLVPAVVGVTHANRYARGFFASAPFRFLGEISYSLYMMHALVQIIILNRIAERFPPNWTSRPVAVVGLVVLGMVMSVALGALVRWLIEERARPVVYRMLCERPRKTAVEPVAAN